MTYQTHTPLTPAEQIEATLLGASIYDWNDEKLGTISQLHQSGPTLCAVVDVGRFLGIGSKPVALHLSELSLMRGAQGSVYGVTPRSRDEIEAMPEHHHSENDSMTPDTPEGPKPDLLPPAPDLRQPGDPSAPGLPNQPVPAQNPIVAPPGEITPPIRAAGGRE